MQLYLFAGFSKKKNSTLQPTLTTGTSVDVKLKEGTSLDKPTFIIYGINLSYNYAYLVDAGRYYFISDITLNNNEVFEVTCYTDYLATYRTAILNTTCNILYASNSTKSLVDKRIPVLASMGITESTESPGFTIVDANPTIIVGITGKGSFGAYRLKFASDISDLLDGVDTYTASSFASTLDVCKQFFYGGSAAENLKSVVGIPIVESEHLGSETALYLGNYPCKNSSGAAIYGYPITNPIMIKTTDISIPWHYTDWRRNAPYSSVYLYLPLIGLITIPTSDVIADEKFTIQYAINQTSGDIAVQVKGKTTGRILATASGSCALPTAYGSIGIDTSKMTTAIVTGVGSLVSGISALATGGATVPAALGIAGGMAASALSTIDALGGSGSGSGGLGGGATHGLDPEIHCYVINRVLSDTPDNLSPIMGKPYFGVGKISEAGAFCMTSGASVNIAGFGNDKNEVNTFLDNGIYVE